MYWFCLYFSKKKMGPRSPLKYWKYIEKFSNNFFSRTTESISTKLCTNPWVKGILDYSNVMPLLFPRGDDHEILKIHWQNFKIFFYRTPGLISIKLSKKHPWVKRIWVCSNGKATHFHNNWERIAKLEKYINEI